MSEIWTYMLTEDTLDYLNIDDEVFDGEYSTDSICTSQWNEAVKNGFLVFRFDSVKKAKRHHPVFIRIRHIAKTEISNAITEVDALLDGMNKYGAVKFALENNCEWVDGSSAP